MRVIAAIAALSFVAAADELPPHVLQLARLRANMRQHLATIPDYTCLSVTERYRLDPKSRTLRLVDRVRLEVAYVGQRELYAWPDENEFHSDAPAEMIGSGMFGSGDFVSHARAAFTGNYDVTRYAGESTVSGRELLRWDYSISPMFTNWTVGSGFITAHSGAAGSYWVDPQTLDLQTLEVRTQGLPPDFPINEVRTVIEYARTRIGSREIVLPQRSVTSLSERSGLLSENRTEFSHCRQYAAQSVVRYLAPEAALRSAPGQEPASVQELQLAAGLRVQTALDTPIDSRTAVVGQSIQASVTEDVRRGKDFVIPRGAGLTGRLRRLEFNPGPPPSHIIALEFTELSFGNFRARFLASMTYIGIETGARIRTTTRSTAEGTWTQTVTMNYALKETPGVGTFVIEREPVQLPAGLQMVWTTLDIRSRK